MSSVASGAAVACSACGRKFKWKDTLAGKKAKCVCGQLIVFPATAPGGAAPTPMPVAAPARAPARAPAPAPRPAPRPAPQPVAVPLVDELPVIDEPAAPPASSHEYDLRSLSDMENAAPAAAPTAIANVCPKCSAPMAKDAVLCTRCGYNTRTGRALNTKVKTGPDVGDVAAGAAKAAGKMVGGLVAGGVAALIAGGVWGGIAVATEYEIGYVAWGVGLLTGLAIRIVNPSGGAASGLAAAAFALMGLGVGKLVILSKLGVLAVSPYDILWVVLAVSSAYKLAAGSEK